MTCPLFMTRLNPVAVISKCVGKEDFMLISKSLRTPCLHYMTINISRCVYIRD